MHSYYNKLLPNHFDEYFIPISSINFYYTKLSTSNNMFSSLLQDNVHLLAQKSGFQYHIVLSLLPILSLNGNLPNTSYLHEKIHNYAFSQHFT